MPNRVSRHDCKGGRLRSTEVDPPDLIGFLDTPITVGMLNYVEAGDE